MRNLICLGYLLAIIASLTSCGSLSDVPADRREILLTQYPVGKTTKQDVRQNFLPILPERQFSRPREGWGILKHPLAAKRFTLAETRSGKAVASIDQYHTSDGLFSLCLCYFYFDKNDRLVDAEWHHATD